jgi:hypothetical protein
MITAMLAAAVPLATPLAQTGGAANTNGVAATAHAKSDDAAAREFAALLGSMLPAPVTPLAPAPVRVELESLADAGIDAESDDATTDELGRADGGMLEESGESLHRHGVASMPILIDDAPPEDSVPLKRATGVERPEVPRPLRPAETVAERRRAIAAANATARELMAGATEGTRALMTSGAAPAGTVVASTDTLDADFSARLDRVIDRMRLAGHDVQVRETLRSPERQQALYAQGRTATGPVVTWTLDSRHLEGKAADVLVDGRSSGKAYDLLHAIAAEEGLRTLGSRDPGHLELPRTTVDAREGAAARRGLMFAQRNGTQDAGLPTMVVRPGGIAQVARVAQVAQVAQVATPGLTTNITARTPGGASERAQQVAATRARAVKLGALPVPDASVVSAAAPDATATLRGPDAALRARIDGETVEATVPSESADASAKLPANGDASTGRGARGRDGASTEAERDGAARDAENTRSTRQSRGRTGSTATLDHAPRAQTETMREAIGTSGTRHTAPITPAGSLAAERVADLLAARDAQPTGPLGELRLALDPATDGVSEVRLALQNGSLDATLRTSDAGIARGLAAEVSTLTRSLERQGFESARVSVQLDAAQQARAVALDTVAAAEATARERALRGDSDASREGRDQATARDAQRDAHRDQQFDQQRDQQHTRQFGSRRARPF